eukprot:GDKH01007503.1.p1 GENE.GDKH01007503.1~~GDKH01007503.1.p1  ORF type:complete len:356 (+),score=40.04 GDKH01007503.1:88-1155(+)
MFVSPQWRALLLQLSLSFIVVCADDCSLSSWNDGAAKSSLLSFFRAAGGLSQAQRVATFDIDGTLIPERPLFELIVAHSVLCASPTERSAFPWPLTLHATEAAMRYCKKRPHDMRNHTEIVDAIVSAFDGWDERDVTSIARSLLFDSSLLFPTIERPLAAMLYSPMLEVIACLRQLNFQIFLFSASQQAIVRPLAELLHIRPEQVIGSTVKMWVDDQTERPGGRVLVRRSREENEFLTSDVKATLVVQRLGTVPALAAGNSGGDRAMLELAQPELSAPSVAGLALLIDHDDEDREFHYPLQEKDPGLIETALARGWAIASVRGDFGRVFVGAHSITDRPHKLLRGAVNALPPVLA